MRCWKKLQDKAVDASEFRMGLQRVTKLEKVLNYYGMVEQTGSIYMECECGHLHASNFSDVSVYRPSDFQPCPFGERGLISVTSLLPTSYPEIGRAHV